MTKWSFLSEIVGRVRYSRNMFRHARNKDHAGTAEKGYNRKAPEAALASFIHYVAFTFIYTW